MFAIVSIAGKQVRVEEGKKYTVLLPFEQKGQKKISFSDILAVSDEGKTIYGNPLVEKATVETIRPGALLSGIEKRLS